MTRRSHSALALCVGATLVLTAADLWTKDWAQESISRANPAALDEVCPPERIPQRRASRSVVLVEGYLEFRYTENCAAAFGLFEDVPRWLRMGLFYLAAIVAMSALMWMFAQGSGGPLFAWSVPLVVSGALGNLVDRLRLGYVIDFIRFHIQDSFYWPTFNLADSTITIGVILLLLDGWLPHGKSETTENEPPDEDKAGDTVG